MVGTEDDDDLVDSTEIADRLGLAYSATVHNWRRRYADFPAPKLRHRRLYLWSWREVERWARATGRLSDD